MAKNSERIIEIPDGIDVSLENAEFTARGFGKETKKKIDLLGIDVKIENRKIKISSEKSTRRELKIIGTTWAHLRNMIKGLQEDFVYKLEICNVHFPMNVKVENDEVVIKSFLGEKIPRTAKILPNVKVEIKGNEIIVSSHNLENAGQTAANMERATKITGRDRRVFQDGIFIKEKCGEKI